MRTRLLGFFTSFIAAGLAVPQAINQAGEQVDPAREVTVRKAGSLPDWRGLKFDTLRTVKPPRPVEFTLPNGMRCFLLENHELPLVRGSVLVRTGNLFDPKEKRGLATITGITMRSGGTRELTGDQMDENLEQVGASIESQIGESSGGASFSCLKKNRDMLLAMFRDMLTQPEFRADKINLAKKQIMSAISRRNDEPSGIGGREFSRLLYGPDTPYGGQEELPTISAVTREDVQAFYKRYYFPSNTILSVFGDFSADEMKQQLTHLFGSWNEKRPPVPDFPKVVAKAAPGTFFVQAPDVAQTFFTIGHLGGELRDPDFAALSVASDILGGGFGSRLVREVRTRLGYAYSVYAGWQANYDHPGVFQIGGSTQSKTTTEAIQAVLKQVDLLRASPVTDEELETSKSTVLNSFVFAFERPSSAINRVVTYEYFHYPPDFLTQYQEAIKKVTKQDVLRVAAKYFRPESFTIVAVGNQAAFGQPLTVLGRPVKALDISIPQEPQSTSNSAAPKPKPAQE